MARLNIVKSDYLFYCSLYCPGRTDLILMKVYYKIEGKKWGYRLFNGTYRMGLTYNQVKSVMVSFERKGSNGHTEDRLYVVPKTKGLSGGRFITDSEFREIYGDDWAGIPEFHVMEK